MSGVVEYPREAIALVLAEAPTLCAGNPFGDCRWYHASWPVLKGLGVFISLKSDDDFLLPQLRAAISGGARRILVSGTADAGMLARIAACRDAAPDGLDITVLDCCPTPLALCRQYAERAGLPIRTVQADILNYREGAEAYDLICTHSFLTFFDAAQRLQLVRQWHALLKPGGALITAQRVRPDETALITRYPADEVEALQDKAERLAALHGAALGVDAGLARHSAWLYGAHHQTHLIADADQLRAPFDAAGFVLRHFSPPPADAPVADVPGAPGNAQAVRWRILAQKSA
ncbi:class I SAM-dependent methyltransferase [Arenimonas sp.]|jgi:SAM-dependent methyltransferase|uniref:class I SAM-dependent methyltransferase n=1 Tax=Arenimonas sp. TaxID=1872635 RepID=UPI0037BEFBF0